MSATVYYVAINQFVKIGTTANLRKRIRHYSVTHSALLAIEPGDRATEASRHRQFAHLRQPGRELFSHAADLDDHIDQVRLAFGDPITFLGLGDDRIDGRCLWCAAPMPVPARVQGGGRSKIYCSPACKQAAYRARATKR